MIQNQVNENEFNIENILYLIKQYKFKKDIIKQKLNLDIDLVCDINEESAIIELNGKYYEIMENSRIINFKDGHESKEIFIYSENHLKEVLNKLGFKAFNISIEDENSWDSLDSENNNNEIHNIFINTKIITIYKDKTNLDKIKEKFKKRDIKNKIYISDICFNSSFYYPNNRNDKLNINLLRKNINEFYGFLSKDCNVLYIVGPKDVSKSLFLLINCHIKNMINKIPLLYINYRKMVNLNYEKKKNIFKKEMIYLFFEENALINFYNEKVYEGLETKNLLEFIRGFIEYLLDTFKNYFRQQILLVIDDLDEDDDEINNLIELIKMENNRSKIRLIISGRSQFIYNKQLLYLKNELNMKSVRNHEMLLYYNIELNENIEINTLPLYLYEKNKDFQNKKEKILDEEIKFCGKFNFYGIHYSILNEGRNIKISDLEKQYNILPNDYLVFNINKDNTISFKFHNEIFKSAAKKSIEFSIKSDNFEYIIKESFNDKNKILYGIYEEKLLSLFFAFNKLELKDLAFQEKNILEVEEIYKFKDLSYSYIKKNFDKTKPIIIIQKNYLGKNYELLILIPNKIFNNYKAYFIQIGVNKTKEQIIEIKKDLDENKLHYEAGIKKYVDCSITEIELVFLFDKDIQIEIYDKDVLSGAKYCIFNKILFYLFSVEDFKLYSTSDMKEFSVNKKFEKIHISSKKRSYRESKGDFSFLSREEIYLINGLINDNILDNYQLFICKDTTIKNLKEHEKDCIYIYNQENIANRTIYVIKNKYYCKEEGTLKNISKAYVDQKGIYKLKMLKKITKKRFVGPKLKK